MNVWKNLMEAAHEEIDALDALLENSIRHDNETLAKLQTEQRRGNELEKAMIAEKELSALLQKELAASQTACDGAMDKIREEVALIHELNAEVEKLKAQNASLRSHKKPARRKS